MTDDDDKMYKLMSELQKSIRWREINPSRYFAQELIDMERPHAAFGQLRIIAAEDIGLADPTIVGYVSECLDNIDDLRKQYGIEKKDVVNVAELPDIVDRAVIAEAISYKSRLLDMATFATLFDIYKNEKFSKSKYEYFNLFVDALENDNEKKALYYAFIVDKISGDKKPILRKIQDQSGKRNEDLIQKWIYEYEKHEKLLNLAGSIVLLCRDLDFTHEEYKDNIQNHLSIPIKATKIPDRAYDKHTRAGRNMRRGLKYFFNVSGTIKKERLEIKNNWQKVGKDAFYSADRVGLANADLIIEAIKAIKAIEKERQAQIHKKGVLTM
jgi:hypothetical protein